MEGFDGEELGNCLSSSKRITVTADTRTSSVGWWLTSRRREEEKKQVGVTAGLDSWPIKEAKSNCGCYGEKICWQNGRVLDELCISLILDCWYRIHHGRYNCHNVHNCRCWGENRSTSNMWTVQSTWKCTTLPVAGICGMLLSAYFHILSLHCMFVRRRLLLLVVHLGLSLAKLLLVVMMALTRGSSSS